MVAAHPRRCGCGMVVEAGKRCSRCNRQREQYRGSAHQRGYGVRWRRASAAYLDEHPLCVECEGRGKLTAAMCVDHIIPHRGNWDLFWDVGNWQSLCKRCHDRKTARGE